MRTDAARGKNGGIYASLGDMPQRLCEIDNMEMDAVYHYQHYPDLNTHILSGNVSDSERVQMQQLDRLMKPLKGKTLYRVTVSRVLKAYMEQVRVNEVRELIGKEIVNIPYLSMTTNPIEEMLAIRRDITCETPVCMELYADNGIRGIDVNDYLMDKGIENNFAWQKEVILERNLHLKVDSVREQYYRDWHYWMLIVSTQSKTL